MLAKKLKRLLLDGAVTGPWPDDRGCVPEPPPADRGCYPEPPSGDRGCYPAAPRRPKHRDREGSVRL